VSVLSFNPLSSASIQLNNGALEWSFPSAPVVVSVTGKIPNAIARCEESSRASIIADSSSIVKDAKPASGFVSAASGGATRLASTIAAGLPSLSRPFGLRGKDKPEAVKTSKESKDRLSDREMDRPTPIRPGPAGSSSVTASLFNSGIAPAGVLTLADLTAACMALQEPEV